MVLASKLNCGQYSFVLLVHNIKSWCLGLDLVNKGTMCLCYLDDEDSWINPNFDDVRGFSELWQWHEWFLKESSRELNYVLEF